MAKQFQIYISASIDNSFGKLWQANEYERMKKELYQTSFRDWKEYKETSLATYRGYKPRSGKRAIIALEQDDTWICGFVLLVTPKGEKKQYADFLESLKTEDPVEFCIDDFWEDDPTDSDSDSSHGDGTIDLEDCEIKQYEDWNDDFC